MTYQLSTPFPYVIAGPLFYVIARPSKGGRGNLIVPFPHLRVP